VGAFFLPRNFGLGFTPTKYFQKSIYTLLKVCAIQFMDMALGGVKNRRMKMTTADPIVAQVVKMQVINPQKIPKIWQETIKIRALGFRSRAPPNHPRPFANPQRTAFFIGHFGKLGHFAT
jgi:hypothetical protein